MLSATTAESSDSIAEQRERDRVGHHSLHLLQAEMRQRG
jgi:hypothetical protein